MACSTCEGEGTIACTSCGGESALVFHACMDCGSLGEVDCPECAARPRRVEPARAAPRRQCEKCPWKRGVDPRAIPGGYDEARHRALACTIRSGAPSLAGGPVMACHETPVGAELPCVGWLVNRLGPGNDIGLRLAVASGRVDDHVETVGPQHATFEDTLP